jgi:hypothetical protein
VFRKIGGRDRIKLIAVEWYFFGSEIGTFDFNCPGDGERPNIDAENLRFSIRVVGAAAAAQIKVKDPRFTPGGLLLRFFRSV